MTYFTEGASRPRYSREYTCQPQYALGRARPNISQRGRDSERWKARALECALLRLTSLLDNLTPRGAQRLARAAPNGTLILSFAPQRHHHTASNGIH